jgi:hypothetical protein
MLVYLVFKGPNKNLRTATNIPKHTDTYDQEKKNRKEKNWGDKRDGFFVCLFVF